MNKTNVIKLIVLVVVVIAVGLGAYLLGDKHALNSLAITKVTPDQAANDMKNDNFYANYRESTILLTGTVSSVSKINNDLIVGFKNNSTYKTLCDFGSSALPTINKGFVITVLSEGELAQRQPSAVMLEGCVLPSNG